MSDNEIARRGRVETLGGNVMRQLLAVAVDGIATMPSAKVSAGRALAKHGDPETAISAIVTNHLAMAGAQGFVTNLGGVLTLPVLMPTNMVGVALVKLHLVASIAHLRGYDVADPRVRTAIMLTLLTAEGDIPEDIPTSILAVATAPAFDEELDHIVSERTTTEIISAVGGRRAMTLIGRRIPLIGGVVGGGMDAWSVRAVAQHARAQFVDRRPRPTSS